MAKRRVAPGIAHGGGRYAPPRPVKPPVRPPAKSAVVYQAPDPVLKALAAAATRTKGTSVPPVSTPSSVASGLSTPAPTSNQPTPSTTGPYQGPAGTEAEHPGQQRVPPPDWADPNSPNYERRNYYTLPDGTIIAREPGYYNPDNPYDTGRPGERNKEFLSTYGPFNPAFEGRMSEPGITPWGPGGKGSPAGPFDAPRGSSQPSTPAAPSTGKQVYDPFLTSLLGGAQGTQTATSYQGANAAADPTAAILAAFAEQIRKLPGLPGVKSTATRVRPTA